MLNKKTKQFTNVLCDISYIDIWWKMLKPQTFYKQLMW